MNDHPYPIEFCGNCGVGQKTKETNSCFCDYYSPGKKSRCCSWTPAHWLHWERIVYICSPCKGTKLGPIDQIVKENLRRAAAYCRAAEESHAIPICPHLYFSHFLDDTNPSQRNIGMEIGIEVLKRCDELWVFGKPSAGMAAEIEEAKSLRMPIIYVPEETVRALDERSNQDG